MQNRPWIDSPHIPVERDSTVLRIIHATRPPLNSITYRGLAHDCQSGAYTQTAEGQG